MLGGRLGLEAGYLGVVCVGPAAVRDVLVFLDWEHRRYISWCCRAYGEWDSQLYDGRPGLDPLCFLATCAVLLGTRVWACFMMYSSLRYRTVSVTVGFGLSIYVSSDSSWSSGSLSILAISSQGLGVMGDRNVLFVKGIHGRLFPPTRGRGVYQRLDAVDLL